MAFTVPISTLVGNYLAKVDSTDWKDVKFWSTHDKRHLSLNELTREHIINIARQIVNEACIEVGIDPIPVKTPLARINFGKAPTYEWVLFCKVLVLELVYRDSFTTQLPIKPSAYDHIRKQVEEKVAILSQKYLQENNGKNSDNDNNPR